MTLFCFLLAGMADNGIPVWLLALAMLCDTLLLATGMATGIIHR